MTRESRIAGTIFRAGNPLGQAFVWCAGPSGEFVAEVRSEDDGTYELYVNPGDWNVTAFAAGTDRVEKTAHVTGPGVTRLDFELAG